VEKAPVRAKFPWDAMQKKWVALERAHIRIEFKPSRSQAKKQPARAETSKKLKIEETFRMFPRLLFRNKSTALSFWEI
jgi:hypothetical protein